MSTPIQTVELVRKPFYVTAVQVTAENMEAVAEWCDGKIVMTDRSRAKRLIKCVEVDVLRATADWQKQARVGDWVVKAGAGYKVYTDKALKDSFDLNPLVIEDDDNYGQILDEEGETPPRTYWDYMKEKKAGTLPERKYGLPIIHQDCT